MPFNMVFSAGGCQSGQVHEFHRYAETLRIRDVVL
ncbi:hypothetical protein ALO59_200009 [Pseudomonas amygdali pv. mellea]|nr:hypothetical protein ALO59_200009 [Pseudomonas amygdali pv. mellea]